MDQAARLVARHVGRPLSAVESDIARCDQLLVYTDPGSHRIVGASPVRRVSAEYRGRPCNVLYTSDVAIEPDYRGANVMQRSGMRCFVDTKRREPNVPVVWLFLASTYRSMLVLTRNFAEYWPAPGGNDPALGELVGSAASQLWGNAWSAHSGTVTLNEPSCASLLDVPARFRERPELRAFMTHTDYTRGRYVVCAAPLHARNWLEVARRSALRAVARSRSRAIGRTAGDQEPPTLWDALARTDAFEATMMDDDV